MTPEDRKLAAIAQHTAAARDRMRQRWAEDAAKRDVPIPRPDVPKAVVIPLGPNARLWIRNRVTLKFGPLLVSMDRFEQEKIAAALLRLQSEARAWPDGTMRGIKRLVKRPDGLWESPTWRTVWKDGRCSAKDFDERGELRGEAGIHAVWPDKLDELNHYGGQLVEIAGWGQCTVGDLGWRAQHAKVVRELL